MNANHELIHSEMVALVDDRFKNSPRRGYSELTQEQKYYWIFLNFRRGFGVPIGIRLSRFGRKLLSPVLESYDYAHNEAVTLKVLLMLDENMMHPYYIDSSVIAFYSKEEAAWFKMGGKSLRGFVDTI